MGMPPWLDLLLATSKGIIMMDTIAEVNPNTFWSSTHVVSMICLWKYLISTGKRTYY